MLIGGGHAHVAVLADWIRHGVPESVAGGVTRAVLLTPHRHLRYSGTVPGWIAGQYDRDHGTVNVAALARRAGVRVILGRCAGIDPETRIITTGGGKAVPFDIASIDTGGVGRACDMLGSDPRLLDIRPIGGFVERLEKQRPAQHIAVIGGGAGGTELAFALRNRGRRGSGEGRSGSGEGGRADVTFITGKRGLLPAFSSAVRQTAEKALAEQGIRTIAEDAAIVDGTLVANGRSLEPVDLIVAALGSAAPDWPGKGGLATDEDGFIAVDRHQRSISHPHIFAVGDVAMRQDRCIAHSGVHAVFAGPVLARNLRAVMAGGNPGGVYRARWNNLYLMSTADGSAIASYGPLAARGRWVSYLKHWIDGRWLRKYARLAAG